MFGILFILLYIVIIPVLPGSLIQTKEGTGCNVFTFLWTFFFGDKIIWKSLVGSEILSSFRWNDGKK